MYTGRRYPLLQTLRWSHRHLLWPGAWALLVTGLHEVAGFEWLSVPWLPMSAVAVAVAFFLGFKNNAAYDRTWEARKVYGAIVNASRSWAIAVRDLVGAGFEGGASPETDDASADRRRLIHRHVAWLDALRHQLREHQPWEHSGPYFDRLRSRSRIPELEEDLRAILDALLPEAEVTAAIERINPAVHLIAHQSAHLADLRRRRHLDGFSHMQLQRILDELLAEQGKAERIKKFPFPRQYATVNSIFARIFTLLLPFGLLETFETIGSCFVWATVPFAALVSWVFLTTDQIGDWSENPFEGLANDVPIATMSRAIERDIRQVLGEDELPPARPIVDSIQW